MSVSCKWEQWTGPGDLRWGLDREQHKEVIFAAAVDSKGGHEKGYSRHDQLYEGPVRNTVQESKTETNRNSANV